MKDTFKVSNLINLKESQDLIRYYIHLVKNNSNTKSFSEYGSNGHSNEENLEGVSNYTLGFPIKTTPFWQLVKRCKEYISDFSVETSYLANFIKPQKAHSDWFLKEDISTCPSSPYYSILIPLNVPCKTYTYVFNEEFYGYGNYYINQDRGFVFKKSKDQNAINEEDFIRLSHNTQEELSQLSIKDKHEWSVGDAIFWRRNLVHGGDNYISNTSALPTDIYRLALVVFTYNEY